MIHINVDLYNTPKIDAYTKKDKLAQDGQTKLTMFDKELEDAESFFTNPANYKDEKKLSDKKFSFKVYKDNDVQKALVKAYGLKCAYCESDFAAVTPKEIEHFRPKSAIDTCILNAKELKPGYWWLAGDWSNLLISCVDCNRERTHKVSGSDSILGKQNQFPLADEQVRIRSHKMSSEQEEDKRLLLHPAIDNPMEHLTFDDKALIHPKDNGTGIDPKGKESIRVYALQRGELVKNRLVVLNDLKLKIELLLREVEMYHKLSNIPKAKSVSNLSLKQIDSLRSGIEILLQPGKPYLGMLREHIRREKEAGSYTFLEQAAKIDLEDLI